MIPLTVFRPDDVLSSSDNAADLSPYRYRLLAQGDSWFATGALNLAKNSNLLFEMTFSQSNCVVNCARSGSTLRRMVDQVNEHAFNGLLARAQWRAWDGILLSAGGNDMIAALGSPQIADPAKRLFLKPSEITGDPALSASYLSAAGWQTFEIYLRANFASLIALRDTRAANRNIPVFLHTYHHPTIRNAPAGVKLGPWLFKAAVDFDIPVTLWSAIATDLFDRFAALLMSIAASHTNVHVFNSAQAITTLQPALPGTTKTSGDWVNEIHLTWQGYEKVADGWVADIGTVLV